MHKMNELRAANEERLQKKLREVRRRFVEKLPVGAAIDKHDQEDDEGQTT